MFTSNEVVVLGGGCFWCMEALFVRLNGVLKVESGFCGGKTKNPTYESVCAQETEHVEVVRIEFDPRVISFEILLDVYFDSHDPTSIDRQGDEVGRLYRSMIFYQTEQQKSIAKKVIQQIEAEKRFPSPIVTEVVPAQPFWRAGSEHDSFFEKNPLNPYCVTTVVPKMLRFRRKFAALLKSEMR
ncbi:peptide-methionine (S)-S-oxide reductase MsrA [Deefgea piscis]|uniref:peptide-methionine (S)-S-oxide reductase MsrA n=1 Tax=Deefgea piscis TaxID=2739061 RepID=UPI001C7F57C4|nr:peptide-methionine (S)-S-oxide reductase MsrA [Deefgea piscis]QZA79689.1 peptide-methionine (S)-S-oxide reductase MsrA [Deefgea piscis]